MKKTVLIGGAVVVVIVVVAIAAVVFHSGKSAAGRISYHTSCDAPARSSRLGSYSQAAVSTDAAPCGEIAVAILKKNGTAVDAAVAAMFCVGVVNHQSCGLGGGFFATYYSREEKKAYALDAREVAPKRATPTMYNRDLNPALQGSKEKWYEKIEAANLKGGLAVAVPGEAPGLYELYRRFGGGVPWSELLEPSIKLCEEGHSLNWYTGGILQLKERHVKAEPSMSIFVDPSSGEVLREGDTIYRKQLGQTLRALQDDPEALTRGKLARGFVKDLEKFGGIITEDDLKEYKPIWRPPARFHLPRSNLSLISFPSPGSGLILGLVLNVLDGLNLTKSSLESDERARTHARMVEAFKYAFAKRQMLGDVGEDEAQRLIEELTSELLAASIRHNMTDGVTYSDPLKYGTRVVPGDDHGTAHLSLMAPNGDAIAITASINMAFGAGIRSESTGIIYNNEMADFTTDAAREKAGNMNMDRNAIVPGHRPLSSMSPSIFLDGEDDVRLTLGAAGGTKIPGAIAWVAARHLWMGHDIKEAIDACRSYHTLLPMKVQYDRGFPQDILKYLKEIGHDVEEFKWKTVVNGVARDGKGGIVANADYRKAGQVAGF